MENKIKNEIENKNKSENENENESKNENEKKNEFWLLLSFCFSFSFWFLFMLSKSICIFANSTWPRSATSGQLSLDWPRIAMAFLLNPRGLQVP